MVITIFYICVDQILVKGLKYLYVIQYMNSSFNQLIFIYSII